MGRPQTVVVGIDGAHYELIQPWLDEGRLPNIAEVLESGVVSDLESVLPPVTSPNWKAYATGRNPGQLGIYWWENINTKEQHVYYPSERKREYPEFWELIAQDDPVGVIGVPTTYPPTAIDVFYVAGAPDAEESGFAHPESVESFLKEELDYRVTKSKAHRMENNPNKAAADILNLIELRFQAADRLLDRYNVSFLQVTTFYINTLQHYCWDGEYTRRGWEIIDKYIGNYLTDDVNLVLMSDHGSNKIELAFHINTWLQQEGYLHLNKTVSDLLYRLGMDNKSLSGLAKTLQIREVAPKLVPDKLLQHIPESTGEVTKEAKAGKVDWEKSEALASGQGPVYLTLGNKSARYEIVRNEIIKKLEKLKAPDNRPIVNNVHKGEKIYSGKYIDEAPDIVIDQAPGIHILGGIGRDTIFSEPSEEGWKAENKRKGLFAASGPDFAAGQIENLSILDLAPTLLHLHNQTIPESLDGSVRSEIFSLKSDAKSREPTISDEVEGYSPDSKVDEIDLKSKLEDLGYLR